MKSNSMPYEWVIAGYPPSDETGKKVLSLADHGVGYYLLNPQRMKTDNIIVGFRRAANTPIPHHLTLATPQQAEKLEKMLAQRFRG